MVKSINKQVPTDRTLFSLCNPIMLYDSLALCDRLIKLTALQICLTKAKVRTYSIVRKFKKTSSIRCRQRGRVVKTPGS